MINRPVFNHGFIRIAVAALTCIAVAPISGALAEDKPKPVVKTAREEIKAFCGNIADSARDQRYLLQKSELEKLQGQVDERIAVLEKRKTEYEEWLKKRNDFLKQAEGGLVDIYKKMKPDAAALQLEQLEPILASAIIMKLPPRQSSLILSEMESKKAAMVAAVMSSAGDRNSANRTKARNPS
ncbi:MotE family protein [Rhizobium sp. KVB221]|uniref:MotE family protein n=1 Tax=Rhizobium setariae TaxID=2801340 RepID=A0A936YQU0_9HYPH|nr:MotE family protein [Rhizobium setariae]MBL0370680.1 MotE family protein [Rhizobium setariae]